MVLNCSTSFTLEVLTMVILICAGWEGGGGPSPQENWGIIERLIFPEIIAQEPLKTNRR